MAPGELRTVVLSQVVEYATYSPAQLQHISLVDHKRIQSDYTAVSLCQRSMLYLCSGKKSLCEMCKFMH